MSARLRSKGVLATIAAAMATITGGLALGFWVHGEKQAAQRIYRVGIDTLPLPPYSVVYPDGSVGGLFVDVINTAARRAGVRIQWTPVSLNYDQALDRKVIDMWPGTTVTTDRQRRYHPTVPWLEISSFIIRLQGTSGPPRHLAALPRPASSALGKRFFPSATMMFVWKREQILQAVCSRAADAGWDDTRGLNSALLERPEGCESAKLAIERIPGVRYLAITSQPDAAWAADRLRRQISRMVTDRTLAPILNKWEVLSAEDSKNVLLLDLANRRNRVFAYMLGAAGLVLAVLLLLAICLYRARRAAESASHARAGSEQALSLEADSRRRAEEILEARTVLLDTLIQTSPIAILMHDENRYITSVNPAFCETFGFMREECVGRKMEEFFVHSTGEGVYWDNHRLIRDGAVVHRIVKRLTKDGRLLDVEMHARRLVIDGKYRGAFGLYQDITKRIEAEAALRHSEEVFRMLSAASPVGIFRSDKNGGPVYGNEKLEQITGFPNDQAMRWGSTFIRMIAPWPPRIGWMPSAAANASRINTDG